MKFLTGQFIFFNFVLIAVHAVSIGKIFSNFYQLAKGQEVEELNCFDANANWDWTDHEKFQTTLEIDDLHEKFYLVSRKRLTRVDSNSDEDILGFDDSKPIVILIHGFMSHSGEDWVVEMERAYLKKADVNVVIVDWSHAAKSFNYATAASKIQHVSYKLSRFMRKLISKKPRISNGTKFNSDFLVSVHCVGHSLGAHVCGLAAKIMKQFESIPPEWKIQRITGLDPAQPCFENPAIRFKLMKDDAPFVDVIHTNMQIQNNLGMGLPETIGHMDFYPNGGHQQPGCADHNVFTKMFSDITTLPLDKMQEAICSHGRAYAYFTESLLLASPEGKGRPVSFFTLLRLKYKPQDKKVAVFPSSPWNRTLEDAERTLKNKRCDPSTDKHCVEMGIDAIRYSKNHAGDFFTVTAQNPPFNEVLSDDKKIVDELLTRMKSFLAQKKDEHKKETEQSG